MPKSHNKRKVAKAAKAALPVPQVGEIWLCRRHYIAHILQVTAERITVAVYQNGAYVQSGTVWNKCRAGFFCADSDGSTTSMDLKEKIGTFDTTLPELKVGQIWQCRRQERTVKINEKGRDGSFSGRLFYYSYSDLDDAPVVVFKDKQYCSYVYDPAYVSAEDLTQLIYDPS